MPPFDYNQLPAGKSYLDLVLLRNEVYARTGYCFMNSAVRNHFDHFKWCRPVWEGGEYDDQGKLLHEDTLLRVSFNHQEAAFAQRVHTQEVAVLARHNFAIVPTREEQLFYLYDQNDYSYTPNFVTTDLILQLLHKYLNLPAAHLASTAPALAQTAR